MGEAVAPREALALAEELEPYLVSVVSKRELWKPWANDPESFERAVLADLEQSVGGAYSRTHA
jgi:hypothetical protein